MLAVRQLIDALTAISLEDVLNQLGHGRWDKYWGWGGCAEFAFGFALWLGKNGIKAEVASDDGEKHFVVRAKFGQRTVNLDASGMRQGSYPKVFGQEWLKKSGEFVKRFNVLDTTRVAQLANGEDPEIPEDWKDPHA